ncbi:hypothetical protein [Clostridium merdae]|uniref:hypothetical protein n=1 Tax=Clostridium merdae TaxID=1958780 RepID=UPI000A26A0DF|nr:hypothetical protein [Clostridium merdae]
MKNEIRAFLFLAFAVISFCTHQICDRLFWVAAYLSPIRPNEESLVYGGVALFCISIVCMVLSIFFFVKAFHEKRE